MTNVEAVERIKELQHEIYLIMKETGAVDSCQVMMVESKYEKDAHFATVELNKKVDVNETAKHFGAKIQALTETKTFRLGDMLVFQQGKE